MAAQDKPTPPIVSGDFDSLVSSIVHIHQQTQDFAAKAVNVALTLRNWLIGCRIEVYERLGADRATYGDKLMDTLAQRLVKQGWARCERRELYRFRQFYLVYPKIVESLTPQSLLLPELSPLLALIPLVSAQIRESVKAIRDGYVRFKREKDAQELAAVASKHGLPPESLEGFVNSILGRMIFDGEQLSDLYAPYDLGWKERAHKETAPMEDCAPYLVKRAGEREISGLSAYDE